MIVHNCGTLLTKGHNSGNIIPNSFNYIVTFSKQAFNESLEFCNHSSPHELHKFDRQLPSSLARAIRFEHRTHSPEVTLVL